MTLIDDLDRRRERVAQDNENSARLAHAYAVFTTEGQGTSRYQKRIPFGLTFIEKPVIGYASQCDMEELADILELDPDEDDDVPLPVCSGYVVQWDQDERGFYTGCWVAARVNFPSIDAVSPDALPSVEHHFTFSAVGMKDIPPDLQDAIE